MCLGMVARYDKEITVINQLVQKDDKGIPALDWDKKLGVSTTSNFSSLLNSSIELSTLQSRLV